MSDESQSEGGSRETPADGIINKRKPEPVELKGLAPEQWEVVKLKVLEHLKEERLGFWQSVRNTVLVVGAVFSGIVALLYDSIVSNASMNAETTARDMAREAIESQVEDWQSLQAQARNLLREADETNDQIRFLQHEMQLMFNNSNSNLDRRIEEVDNRSNEALESMTRIESALSNLDEQERELTGSVARIGDLLVNAEQLNNSISEVSASANAALPTILGTEGVILRLDAVDSRLEGLESQYSSLNVQIGAAQSDLLALGMRIGGVDQIVMGILSSGPVFAFDHASVSDFDACPEGWEPYDGAEGRFILGAGQGPLRGLVGAGEDGGEEEVTLTVAQMPVHNHETVRRQSESNQTNDFVMASGDAIPLEEGGVDTSPAGGGRPHNNMPPYIALVFCTPDPTELAGR